MSTTAENPVFENIQKKYGFVPNILREMGDVSPTVLKAYLAVNAAIDEGTLSQREIHTASLAVSVFNGCGYCRSAHTALLKSLGVSEGDIRAIRDGKDPSDARLKSLVRAVRLLCRKRGWLDKTRLEELEKDGIGKAQVYELVGLIAMKTITNYINHINHTELDKQFGG